MFVAFCILVLLIWLGLWLHTRKHRGPRSPKPICRRDLRNLKRDLRLWQAGVRPKITEDD